jgi:phage shock protein A
MTLEELSRLDYSGAMDLLFAYTTDIKRHDKDIEALKKDIALWTSRVSLAEGKGMTELAAGARGQVTQLEAKLSEIQASKGELQHDAIRIKEALPGIKAKARSIDPDRLQAELAMMTGEALDPEKAKLDRELDALSKVGSPDDPLAALKRKMGLAPQKNPDAESDAAPDAAPEAASSDAAKGTAPDAQPETQSKADQDKTGP